MISNKFDLPIVISNANSFSETGYVGPTITDLLRKLYIISGKQLEKAQRGDRKSTRLNSSHIATSRMPSSA